MLYMNEIFPKDSKVRPNLKCHLTSSDFV
jgi:hypothetical protein